MLDLFGDAHYCKRSELTAGAVKPSFDEEQYLAQTIGSRLIAGVDEVGRGALAGPVMAAAVILPSDAFLDAVIPGLNDSKKLSATRRTSLAANVREVAVAWALGAASRQEIDRYNIWGATKLAMARAIGRLPVRPAGLLVDGKQDPQITIPTHLLVKGDSRSASVAAASIMAKVFRDKLMAQLGARHPAYGWAQNAGYGSAAHRAAIDLVGISAHHRQSFDPIRSILHQKNTITD